MNPSPEATSVNVAFPKYTSASAIINIINPKIPTMVVLYDVFFMGLLVGVLFQKVLNVNYLSKFIKGSIRLISLSVHAVFPT